MSLQMVSAVALPSRMMVSTGSGVVEEWAVVVSSVSSATAASLVAVGKDNKGVV